MCVCVYVLNYIQLMSVCLIIDDILFLFIFMWKKNDVYFRWNTYTLEYQCIFLRVIPDLYMMSRVIVFNLLFLTSNISIVITHNAHLEIIYITLCFQLQNKWVTESFIHNRRLFCYGTVYFYKREIKTSALPALCEGNPPVFGGTGLHWIPLASDQ